MFLGPAVDPGANITKVLSAKSLSPQLLPEKIFTSIGDHASFWKVRHQRSGTSSRQASW